MPTLLYIHGFLSSPASAKAVQLAAWLAEHRPSVDFVCPLLSPYPEQARLKLTALVEQADSPLGVMGSSLGGYWATWLAETYDLRAVLINPSVNPMAMFPQYLHRPVKNFHTDEVYCLKDEHLEQLSAVDTPHIARTDNYWLLAQTGDETLDYRLAEAKYAGCHQTIEPGGDHGFCGFERFIAPAVAFAIDAVAPEHHVRK